MSGDKATELESPKTLFQAHVALVRIRPTSSEPLTAWKAYYDRSVAFYREIAEIDRGHHHEALYWAEREQKSADEIATQITAEKAQKNPQPDATGRK
ncbi:MAG: AMED_5909 family protein [Pseudonocardiaceae bacterium]